MCTHHLHRKYDGVCMYACSCTRTIKISRVRKKENNKKNTLTVGTYVYIRIEVLKKK